MSMFDTIPPISDELGRSWKQPCRSLIAVDEDHALMSRETFEKLERYDCSRPSALYVGKMWSSVVRTPTGRVISVLHVVYPGETTSEVIEYARVVLFC